MAWGLFNGGWAMAEDSAGARHPVLPRAGVRRLVLDWTLGVVVTADFLRDALVAEASQYD